MNNKYPYGSGRVAGAATLTVKGSRQTPSPPFDISVRQDEIKNITPMGRSLMPEGILDTLSDQQIRDLFAFLKVTQPISK